MSVSLIGCGCSPESLTREAAAAIDRAELLIGAARLLAPYQREKRCAAATAAGDIAAILEAEPETETCVLFSGDSGFYSGARLLLPLLKEEPALLPGLASVQLFAARLRESWQDWRLCSAHGVSCDPVAELCRGKKTFFLTGGRTGPDTLCRRLREAGLGFLPVVIGESLGYEDERLIRTTVEEASHMHFASLSVLLAEAAPRLKARTPGLPDEDFVRAENIPMTKQELRAVILSKLAVGPEDCCWDIGAGTGSVAVELALQAGAVWGVERSEAALALAEQNRRRFGAWNLRLVSGSAPAALAGLPAPDAVFVGGSGGKLREILEAVHTANPAARVCVSAIALETLETARAVLKAHGMRPEICQISVSRGRDAGSLTMMTALNPVWLIVGRPT